MLQFSFLKLPSKLLLIRFHSCISVHHISEAWYCQRTAISSYSMTQQNDTATTNEESIRKKCSTIRDLCIDLLHAVKQDNDESILAQKLESITPQLERHTALQRKLQSWNYSDDFDSIGTIRSLQWKQANEKVLNSSIMLHVSAKPHAPLQRSQFATVRRTLA